VEILTGHIMDLISLYIYQSVYCILAPNSKTRKQQNHH